MIKERARRKPELCKDNGLKLIYFSHSDTIDEKNKASKVLLCKQWKRQTFIAAECLRQTGGWLGSLFTKYFYLPFNDYFYLFFRNILISFFLCGTVFFLYEM